MAATRLISMHANGKNSIAACLKARLDYSKNPDKTEQGLGFNGFETIFTED